ncbi:MAG: cupin domain-containing protein [Chloroflexota bacterium]|nr:cupin domain-containing protein [Chloroflexota bacterium]
MAKNYSFYQDLAAELPEIPTDTTISRMIYDDDHIRVVVFGFAPGQELTEHTSAMAAILQIVQGEATLTLGADSLEVAPGAWVRMAPNLPHSVKSKTEVVMLLTLIKGSGS